MPYIVVNRAQVYELGDQKLPQAEKIRQPALVRQPVRPAQAALLRPVFAQRRFDALLRTDERPVLGHSAAKRFCFLLHVDRLLTAGFLDEPLDFADGLGLFAEKRFPFGHGRRVMVHNILRGAETADLTGVQRRSARPIHAVAAVHLADGEQAVDFALPPFVSGDAAVIVLRADGDRDFLSGQINAVIQIGLNRRRIHSGQPLERRFQQRAAVFQIAPRFLRQTGKIGLSVFFQRRAFQIYWYDVVFQTGIVLFILIVFHGLIGQVSDDVHFRVEQSVSQRMALQDGMTDFKSAQALEQKLAALHQHAHELSNAALTYVHLRDLKAINDLHGMKAGDEAVVAAAQCISSAFPEHAAWETSFYRVSGDEFAVVQLNPILPMETLEAKLHENAMRLNRRDGKTHGALRLACGYSLLRAPDGEPQTVSNWKESANAMLQTRLSSEKNGGGFDA